MDNFEPNIVYEDNHMLVVIKPKNVAVQEDSSGDADLLTMLKEFIKARDAKPGNVYLGLVHRLDRPTGGVMMFAKTSKCAERLSQQLRDRLIVKTYLCVVLGKPQQPDDTLSTYLVKQHDINTVRLGTQSEPEAKLAKLQYDTIYSAQGKSLLRVELFTGRSHQIRVQMAAQNKTVVYGDFKYGDKAHGGNLALWAYELKFLHPVTKKNMVFRSLPPIEEAPWSVFAQNLKEIK